MEIKTCEEYVLNELQLTQDELLRAQIEVEEIRNRLNETMKSLNELKTVLINISTYVESVESRIDFVSCVWEWDPLFKKLTNLVPLIKKQKE